jgi:hypothetical protein
VPFPLSVARQKPSVGLLAWLLLSLLLSLLPAAAAASLLLLLLPDSVSVRA